MRRDKSGTTLYLGETEVLLKSDGTLEGTRYYDHGGQTIAVRVGNMLTWLGADHHGTAHTAIDAGTQNVQRRRTDPYGNIRGSAPTAWPGQRGFVGGTNDPSTGLVHLGAREYDPALGRFISVDPQADYEDPQTINGYSYANNSPVTFTDPDGLSWFSSFVSSTVSSFKTVAHTVVNRTVQTVRSAVHTITPVVHWVRDKVTKTVEAVKTFVKKTVHVIKQVVKTVKKVVKKVIKTVKRVVKKVAKKVASAVKNTVKRVAKAAKAAVTKAARAIKKAATDVGNWAWRNREQILSTALDIGLTVAACAATGGAGCVARGLLFVATTTVMSSIPTGAAAAAAVPAGRGDETHKRLGGIPRDQWTATAGPPGGDPRDLHLNEMSDKVKYRDRDTGITPRSLGGQRFGQPAGPRTKWAAAGLAAARLWGVLFK